MKFFTFLVACGVGFFLLITSPCFGVIMTITEGTVSPSSGSPFDVMGYVDFQGPDNVGLFYGAPAFFYLNGLDTFTAGLEMQGALQDRTDLYFTSGGTPDPLGRLFLMSGTVWYTPTTYFARGEVPGWRGNGFAEGVTYREMDMTISVRNSFDPSVFDSIHLVAVAAVPEVNATLAFASLMFPFVAYRGFSALTKRRRACKV